MVVKNHGRSAVGMAVLVAALGYFVDVYDLVLFSIVRTDSLSSLGYGAEETFNYGVLLLNLQMVGMLIGGFVWGLLGDRYGRLKVLFGSILTYSIANVANAGVGGIFWYGFWRFVAGFGLAGELGAGITLVAEIMPRDRRGIGTTLVATVGVLGAVVAASVGRWSSWRMAYLIGGLLGLALLLLRVSVQESELFVRARDKVGAQAATRVSLSRLFLDRSRFKRLLGCLAVGVPTWFVVGVLVTFSPEIARSVGVSEPVLVGEVIQFTYIGLVLGDLISGLLSQCVRSRRRVVGIFLLFNCLANWVFLLLLPLGSPAIYLWCLPLGISVGYWAVFVTMSAELFGTNFRATVATAVPNLVRAATVPLTVIFSYLSPYLGLNWTAGLLGLVCSGLAIAGLKLLPESFDQDLDFHEQ